MIWDISWERFELVHLVWAALAIIGGLAFLEFRAGASMQSFVSRVMQHRLAAAPARGQRIARLVFIGLCLLFSVLALMRPQSETTTESVSSKRVSGDVLIVLDVSKSMLAEDAAPNRLARAKAEISSMIDALAGHRVGLVAFAGKATILSPLTPDYGFFRMMLRGASPSSVSRGGTAIGEAIRLAVSAFDEETAEAARMILLITDGEDHDSYPREAAIAAKEAGIRIVAVGLGSEEGAPILITDRRTGVKKPVLDSSKQPVVSRVDGALLREMAVSTDGAYIPAGTAALDLDSIVDKHIAPLLRDSEPSASRTVASELYPWPLMFALFCLVLSVVVVAPTRRRR